MGRYWGGGSLEAVIIGCVAYGIQFGLGCVVCGVSMFDVFWVLFGVVLGGGFVASGFHCVCVCVRARGMAHLVYLKEKKNLANVK